METAGQKITKSAEEIIKLMNADNFRKELMFFLAKVNRVTAKHRHGMKIPKEDLDALSNEQLIIERMIIEYKNHEE